jgi:hypothetical protein
MQTLLTTLNGGGKQNLEYEWRRGTTIHRISGKTAFQLEQILKQPIKSRPSQRTIILKGNTPVHGPERAKSSHAWSALTLLLPNAGFVRLGNQWRDQSPS